MNNSLKIFKLLLISIFLFCVYSVKSQSIYAHFSNKIVRLNADSLLRVDTFLKVLVPSRQQGTIKLTITPIQNATTADLSTIRVPMSNEFKVGDIVDSFQYPLTVIRDSIDDKILTFKLNAFDSRGKRIQFNDADTIITVYIKPLLRRQTLPTSLGNRQNQVSRDNDSAKKYKAFFTIDSIRLNAGPSKFIDTILTVKIPKADSNFKKFTVNIVPNKILSTVDLSKIKYPYSNQFQIKSPNDSIFHYSLTVPRDKNDDKTAIFDIQVFDSAGKERVLDKGITTSHILIKPLASGDSVTSGDNFETWFFAGTNFDPLNGIKAQEFFFRENTFFKVYKQIFCQVAFYKNRYFTSDSTTNIEVYAPNNPLQVSTSSGTQYSYLRGKYQSNTQQTADLLGFQVDFLWKFKKDNDNSKSTFFGSVGFDISNRDVTFQKTYSNFDTATVLQATTFGRPTAPPPTGPIRFSYDKPAYNFNVGVLWIRDDEDTNVKMQMAFGNSQFSQPDTILIPRGSNTPVFSSYITRNNFYMQARLFLTSKKLGISLGSEFFLRKSDFPQYNFTLSKVFDLNDFKNILSSVSSIKL